jgi:hypothetical protein
MEIYGLYGKGGTGKSYKAGEIVARYRIDAVLDDGLLIVNRNRVAGRSAKNDITAYGATKTAILSAEAHRQEVMNYIRLAEIRKMLIIGTSQKMVERIVSRLDLPRTIEWLPIETFQTDAELMLARDRRRSGYHVIPVCPAEGAGDLVSIVADPKLCNHPALSVKQGFIALPYGNCGMGSNNDPVFY